MDQTNFLFLLIVGLAGYVFGYIKGKGQIKGALNFSSYQLGRSHVLTAVQNFLSGKAVISREPAVKVLNELRTKVADPKDPIVVQLREAKRIYELILSSQSADVPNEFRNLQQKSSGPN